MKADEWPIQNRFLELNSNWLTLFGENLEDHHGMIREYWRIEKAHSVVILTLLDGQILLPKPSYRPGLGKVTLDFPGGRVEVDQLPQVAVPLILQRELGIQPTAIEGLFALNSEGWPINSSFSNQRLFAFVATLSSHTVIASEYSVTRYELSELDIDRLLKDLICLQCRAVLLDWLRTFRA